MGSGNKGKNKNQRKSLPYMPKKVINIRLVKLKLVKYN